MQKVAGYLKFSCKESLKNMKRSTPISPTSQAFCPTKPSPSKLHTHIPVLTPAPALALNIFPDGLPSLQTHSIFEGPTPPEAISESLK